MLAGLLQHDSLRGLLPFARQFYGRQSECLWYDGQGAAHSIVQGEGGEQGDPLMPALFALAQHPALEAVQASLQPDEVLFAFLDDIYVVSHPDRTQPIFARLQTALQDLAGIQLHQGKTRIWNAAGEEPTNLAALQGVDSPDPIWVGNWALPPATQGLTVLGAYIRHALHSKRQLHDALLEPNLQASWLLLLFCASPRCNYLLRNLPPSQTEGFAAAHDATTMRCLARLLSPEWPLSLQVRRGYLPLRLGGLGLRSAVQARYTAYWASWADCLPVLQARLPLVADRLVQLLSGEARPQPPCIQAAGQAAQALRGSGYEPPPRAALVAGQVAPAHANFGEFASGWQHAASSAQDLRDFEALLIGLSPPKRSILLSQAGPHSSRAFTTLPTSFELQLDNAHFRIVLQRRLRMPLPLTGSRCRYGHALDPPGRSFSSLQKPGCLPRFVGGKKKKYLLYINNNRIIAYIKNKKKYLILFYLGIEFGNYLFNVILIRIKIWIWFLENDYI